jgi:hypothetical protein
MSMTVAVPGSERREVSRKREVFRMKEFDAAAASRTIADVLRANLEDAEAQLRVGRRMARRAQRRVADLDRAVQNWQELIEDYERATGSSREQRRN